MEGVLQKLKKSLTGSYWKHHWVVASLEFDEFLQFNSASNPAALPQDTVQDATNDIGISILFPFIIISTA